MTTTEKKLQLSPLYTQFQTAQNDRQSAEIARKEGNNSECTSIFEREEQNGSTFDILQGDDIDVYSKQIAQLVSDEIFFKNEDEDSKTLSLAEFIKGDLYNQAQSIFSIHEETDSTKIYPTREDLADLATKSTVMFTYIDKMQKSSNGDDKIDAKELANFYMNLDAFEDGKLDGQIPLDSVDQLYNYILENELIPQQNIEKVKEDFMNTIGTPKDFIRYCFDWFYNRTADEARMEERKQELEEANQSSETEPIQEKKKLSLKDMLNSN